jgi:hypothetical protein
MWSSVGVLLFAGSIFIAVRMIKAFDPVLASHFSKERVDIIGFG